MKNKILMGITLAAITLAGMGAMVVDSNFKMAAVLVGIACVWLLPFCYANKDVM